MKHEGTSVPGSSMSERSFTVQANLIDDWCDNHLTTAFSFVNHTHLVGSPWSDPKKSYLLLLASSALGSSLFLQRFHQHLILEHLISKQLLQFGVFFFQLFISLEHRPVPSCHPFYPSDRCSVRLSYCHGRLPTRFYQYRLAVVLRSSVLLYIFFLLLRLSV